jgi:hypothetical protein
VNIFGPKIRVSAALYRRLRKCAEAAGYSSTEEFILHVLEKAAVEIEQADAEKAVEERLRGLGYIE